MCWQGEPEHLQLLQHSQFCLLNLSGDQRLQATPDCTNNHIHGHWHTHTTKLTRTTERTWRYHGIQMRAFRLETEPKVARTATWHRLQAALNRNITHLSTNSFHLFFLLSSKTRSDLLCTCKNSHWLYFVGSVDYTWQVKCHLVNTQGSASGILSVPGNTDTAKGSIFSPGATGASGTVPALISAHTGHVFFTLSKYSQTFNLPKDCPLVCPQGRGIKLVIINKEKTLLSSFSSLLCEEHAQLKWFQQRQISWAFSTKTSEQEATLQGPDPWRGQDTMGYPNISFLFCYLKSRY